MQVPTKVAMIILMQHDLEAAVAFYQKLGLRLLFHMKGKWAEFELGGVKIGLCPTSADPIDRRVGVVFAVADVTALYQERRETGIFLDEPTQALHGIMVSLKDPGGNILDLYQATPERIKEYAQRVTGEEQECNQSVCCKNKKATASCTS